MSMFDGFDEFDIPTSGASIHGRRGGSGPPVLLLHGIPETHLMWHRVAPHLAKRYTVVATDLRGYGDSGKPPSTPDHEPYSMRAIGRDQIEVMRSLGYDKFSVVGHDRGARCAYRLALDNPDLVLRLDVMDVVPIGDAYGRADRRFSLAYWVWSFLAAQEPVPEQFIGASPANLVNFMLDTWPEVKDAFPADVRATYIEKFSDPATVHAICEEFRAAATWDYQQDEADRGKRKIACPVLFLWSQRGPVGQLYDDPLAIWRGWSDDVRGGPVPVGHFTRRRPPRRPPANCSTSCRSRGPVTPADVNPRRLGCPRPMLRDRHRGTPSRPWFPAQQALCAITSTATTSRNPRHGAGAHMPAVACTRRGWRRCSRQPSLRNTVSQRGAGGG